jgi:hypothetical protein
MKSITLPVLGLVATWVFACQLITGQALAQWSTNPSVNNAICSAASQQRGPRITSDGSGGAIITWMDDRDIATNSTDIYAQRISASGGIQWTANGVAICTDLGLQSAPQITTDGSGGAIIVWQDNRVFQIPEIFAQRVNASGIVQWTLDGVSLGGDAIGQSQAQLISDGAGGAIVTWKSGTTQFSNIRAQRINASGVIQWGVAGANMSTSLTPEVPQIISDGAGGAIISWNEWVGIYPAGSHDIFAQRINSSGATQWGVAGSAICSVPNSQTASQLASDGSNGAIIVWQDVRSGTASNLFTQRVNSAGAVQWVLNGVAVAPAAVNEVEQRILSDGNGGAYITWRQDNSAIYAQRVNAAGAIQWATSGVSIGSTGTSAGPQMATDGGTGAIITFWRLGGPNGADVYAQKINQAGIIQWPLNGAVISNAVSDQGPQQMIADGNGAIMVWMDDRNNATSSTDIYAQRVNANGTLGGATGVDEDEHSSPATFSLRQNYPNPFNPTTRIDFVLPYASHVTLTVYNMLGQLVATLADEERPAGRFAVDWNGVGMNGNNLSSGVYLYKLATNDFVQTKRLMLLK